MVGGVFGGSLQRLDNMCGGGQIGVPDTKADDVNTLLLDLSFEAVEFREKIWRQEVEPRRELYLHLMKQSPVLRLAGYLTHLRQPRNGVWPDFWLHAKGFLNRRPNFPGCWSLPS